MEEHRGGLVSCALCGNIRSKKVVVLDDEGERCVACRKHFQHHNGNLVNDITARAIIKLLR